MRTSYLFIFALVLISSASAFKTRRSMGTVLTQIRSMMDSKGPSSDVFKLIDGLVTDVKEEQVAHDALRAKQQAQCAQEIDFRTNEIADAEAAFEAAQAHQAKCAASAQNDEANIELNLQNQENTVNTIARIDAKRTQEAAQYARRVTQHKESIEILDEADEFLDELVTGTASLAQIGQTAGKLIKKGVEMRKIGAFAPAVSAFTALATSDDATTYYDADAVERVRALFQKVRDEVNSAFDSYTQAEQAAIELYKKTRAQLVSHLADLKADEQTLRNHLDEMNNCVNQEGQVQASATKKKERNQGLLDDATDLCETQEKQYAQATAARKEELRVLAELRGIVEKRYAQFSKGAAHRADVDEFKAYENQSEYERENYTKEGGEFNAGGAASAEFERNEELERFL